MGLDQGSDSVIKARHERDSSILAVTSTDTMFNHDLSKSDDVLLHRLQPKSNFDVEDDISSRFSNITNALSVLGILDMAKTKSLPSTWSL